MDKPNTHVLCHCGSPLGSPEDPKTWRGWDTAGGQVGGKV